jgi:hypothetical protein
MGDERDQVRVSVGPLEAADLQTGVGEESSLFCL